MPAFAFALYGQPTDPSAFASHYESQHAPLVRAIPGLEAFHVSTGPALGPDGAPVFHQVAMLRFATMDDLQAGLGSPEGQATVGDLANFATGGVTIALFEANDVVSP
jgi:uncharacterized protein (TIGR02118 family)